MAWAGIAIDQLWTGAWVAVLLALLVVCFGRWCRPVTRHALWVVVLAWFVAPALVPRFELTGVAQILPDDGARGVANDVDRDASSEDGDTARLLESAGVAARDLERSPAEDEAAGVVAPSELADSERADNEYAFADYGDRSETPPAPPYPLPFQADRRPVEAPATGVTDSPTTVARSETATPHLLPQASGSDGALDSARGPDAKPKAKPKPRGATYAFAAALREWSLQWADGLAALRGALARIPALPKEIWIGGALLALLVHLAGIAYFARRLRHARPAPRWVRDEVQSIARRVGLSRVPETVLVDERVSPLVWCGRRMRLVLPQKLWSELDRVGRSAILCHELAHLRRRDHWVCWMEIVISTVYWWHPLVWWVRRRIHDEADFCCDAWVTSLMPRGRRAYAEALLKTREYISSRDSKVPVLGMGVTSAGAKCFSRRLTMVMTKSARPGPSAAGIGVACVVALSGWLASPALSFAGAEDSVGTASGPRNASEVVVAPDGGNVWVWRSKGSGPVVTAPPPPPQSFRYRVGRKWPVAVVAPRVAPGPAHGVWAAPLPKGYSGAFPAGENVAVVPGFSGRGEAHAGPEYSGFWVAGPDGDDKALRRRLTELEKELVELSRQLKDRESAPRGAVRPPRGAVRPPRAPRAEPPRPPRGPFTDARPSGEPVVRKYALPEGKLDALGKLMLRDDVPIPVRVDDGKIEVHGTPAQQRVFKAFIDMINPGGKERAAAVSLGGSGSGRAHADAPSAERRAVERVLRTRREAAERGARAFGEARERARRAREEAEQVRVHSERAAREHAESAEVHRREAGDASRQVRELERAIEKLESRSEELSDKAEDSDNRDRRRELQQASRVLERQIRELEREVRRLEHSRRDDADHDGHADGDDDDDHPHHRGDHDGHAEMLSALKALDGVRFADVGAAQRDALRALSDLDIRLPKDAIRAMRIDELSPAIQEQVRGAIERSLESVDTIPKEARADITKALRELKSRGVSQDVQAEVRSAVERALKSVDRIPSDVRKDIHKALRDASKAMNSIDKDALRDALDNVHVEIEKDDD